MLREPHGYFLGFREDRESPATHWVRELTSMGIAEAVFTDPAAPTLRFRGKAPRNEGDTLLGNPAAVAAQRAFGDCPH